MRITSLTRRRLAPLLLTTTLGPGSRRRMDSVFGALGDPTRRSVLERLSRGGTVTSTGLAAKLPISRQAVRNHLVALEDAELVRSDRVGRETRYSLRLEPLDDAARWIQTVSAEWDDRLEALRRTLQRRSGPDQ